jgi:hypothetical protein
VDLIRIVQHIYGKSLRPCSGSRPDQRQLDDADAEFEDPPRKARKKIGAFASGAVAALISRRMPASNQVSYRAVVDGAKRRRSAPRESRRDGHAGEANLPAFR